MFPLTLNAVLSATCSADNLTEARTNLDLVDFLPVLEVVCARIESGLLVIGVSLREFPGESSRYFGAVFSFHQYP